MDRSIMKVFTDTVQILENLSERVPSNRLSDVDFGSRGLLRLTINLGTQFYQAVCENYPNIFICESR